MESSMSVLLLMLLYVIQRCYTCHINTQVAYRWRSRSVFKWDSEGCVEEWQSDYIAYGVVDGVGNKLGATPAPMRRSVPVSLRHHPHLPRFALRTRPPPSRTPGLDITLCCARSFDTLSFCLRHCRIPFTIVPKMHWQTSPRTDPQLPRLSILFASLGRIESGQGSHRFGK